MSDGISLKCGLKPPALMMNVGWSPNAARNANCPEMDVNRDTRVDELGIERDAERIENDRANEIEPQIQQCEVGRDQWRQRDNTLAE